MECGTLATEVAKIHELVQAADDAEAQKEEDEKKSVKLALAGSSTTTEKKGADETDDEDTKLAPAIKEVMEEVKSALGRALNYEEKDATVHFGAKFKRTLWSTVKLLVFQPSETRTTKQVEELPHRAKVWRSRQHIYRHLVRQQTLGHHGYCSAHPGPDLEHDDPQGHCGFYRSVSLKSCIGVFIFWDLAKSSLMWLDKLCM